MRAEFEVFTELQHSDGYKRLMLLWMEDLTEIETKRDTAASKGQESAWRYQAGIEKGYKRAMMKLNEVLIKMDEDGGDTVDKPSAMIEKLLSEARGEQK